MTSTDAGSKMNRRSYLIRSAFLFFAVLFIYCHGVVTSWDSRWTIPTAMSIVREGNTDLDEFGAVMAEDDYRIEQVGGHLYSKYPIGVPVIAVPFVFVADRLASWAPSFDLYAYLKQTTPEDYSLGVVFIELFIASFIVAATTVLIYVLASWYLNRGQALLVAFVFALCTSAWSTSSRALWQHGPSMLMLTIALCLVLLAEKRPSLIQFASVPLALAYVMRPTNGISVLLLTVFVFLQYRKHFFRFLLWALVIAIPFFLYNLSVYRALLPSYFRPTEAGSTSPLTPTSIGANPDFLEALAANLVSPARGLFVFSPILLFSVYGVARKIRNAQFGKLDYCLVGIIILHWIVISSFTVWWAGWSYGPRFFAEIMPYFVYYLIPAVKGIAESRGLRRPLLASAFVGVMVVSLWIHYRGAASGAGYAWNATPTDVDLQPARVWDWRDIQFLRGIQ